MELQRALKIANEIKLLLDPHCDRIEIAGSIRRRKPEVKDIEIVAIPKPYEVGLFASGIALVIGQWQKVKGELPCKYTQRIHQSGIKIDLFFAERGNWGLIYAIRTGSAEFSHKVLGNNWVKKGFKSIDGYLTRDRKPIAVLEEKDLFDRIGIPFIEPENRTIEQNKQYL